MSECEWELGSEHSSTASTHWSGSLLDLVTEVEDILTGMPKQLGECLWLPDQPVQASTHQCTVAQQLTPFHAPKATGPAS